MDWKFKKNLEPICGTSNFWQDVSMGGDIILEKLLDDPKQLHKLKEAIKTVKSFEKTLVNNNLYYNL